MYLLIIPSDALRNQVEEIFRLDVAYCFYISFYFNATGSHINSWRLKNEKRTKKILENVLRFLNNGIDHRSKYRTRVRCFLIPQSTGAE